MSYTQEGLPNGGKTNRFEIHYDTSLSAERGMNLATELMNHCDSDYQWLNTFFPGTDICWWGRQISIWIDNDPSQFLSASWVGWGPTYEMHVRIAENPVSGGMRAADAVRWLVITEVSEMFMRERQIWPFDDWFGTGNEGNKGESLSQVFGIEFIRTRLQAVKSLPASPWSSLWLNTPDRFDFLSANEDTIEPLPIIGCGILFLLFLHDELSYSLDQIVANGGKTLADVYHNLTSDAASNAYTRFANLVNLHYPIADGSYHPALETTFPAPNLTDVYTDTKLSWVSNGWPPKLSFAFDNPIVAETTVHFSSDAPSIIQIDAKKQIIPNAESLSVPLYVKPQPAGFTQKNVTITVSYAGRDLSKSISVVRPQDLPLPPLTIKPILKGDRCERLFEENTSVTFYAANIDIFSDQHGLKYTWTVNGAMANALNTPQITVPTLPSAGTSVTIEVTVENSASLRAHGRFNFQVLTRLDPLEELDRRVRCKLSSMPASNVFIPPWVPIVKGPLSLEHITVVQEQLRAVLENINEMQELLSHLEHGRKKVTGQR